MPTTIRFARHAGKILTENACQGDRLAAKGAAIPVEFGQRQNLPADFLSRRPARDARFRPGSIDDAGVLDCN